MRQVALCLLTFLALTIGQAADDGPSTRWVGNPRAIAQATPKRVSDSAIKRLIIKESIAAYDGNCPCPYNRASNGSQCGRRSAYDRADGEAPLCFPADVTAEMVASYREEHGL